jgi:hypothetical protein
LLTQQFFIHKLAQLIGRPVKEANSNFFLNVLYSPLFLFPMLIILVIGTQDNDYDRRNRQKM